MKKAIAAGVLMLSLALTGCVGTVEPDAETRDSSNLNVSVIETPDGARVTCVVYNRRNYVGGVTCDWDHAK